ncbi:hypothetical protein [Viscerimonas tarda]
MLVLGLSCSLSSCSGDDDAPAPVPAQGTFTKTYSIALNASASTATPSYSTAVPLKLADAIGEENVKNFVTNTAAPNLVVMGIKVRGLEAIKAAGKDETLDLFYVKVGSAEYNLGKVNVAGGGSDFYSDQLLQGAKYLPVAQKTFELLTKDKQVNIAYKFKPAVNISTVDNLNPVYLDITVAGTYTYNTYPKK